MSNKDHLKILKKGVETWNRWRNKHPYIEPNLRRAILKHMDLRKYDFHNAQLNWVNFIGSDLRFCNFQSAHLEDADFTDADISYADLRNAIICDCDFSNTKQIGTIFELTIQNINTIYANSEEEDHD
ncbi:MAG: pentapeptide repeat-containing protein [Anaerolineales bacterium]